MKNCIAPQAYLAGEGFIPKKRNSDNARAVSQYKNNLKYLII
jgi:hypothetical protein